MENWTRIKKIRRKIKYNKGKKKYKNYGKRKI